jgi:ribosomal protein L7Ae-like RNA K-turn-binding protein
MLEKVKGMINFAIRARKYTIGENVITYGKNHKVKLALLATDASDTTKKKYRDKLNYYQIPYIEYGTKEDLASLLNKQEISILAITDINIAKQIRKLIKEDETNGLQ